MKAVVYYRYGAPDVLQIADVEKPRPKAREVLVRVHNTSVTAGDWRMRKAEPFLVRLFNGLFRPRRVNILGFELSGVVEEVGSQVKHLRPGDEVFAFCGFRFGGYAQYRCLPEDENIARKPSNVSFAEAACVPLGAMTALQFLKQAGIANGKRVLIYGASGSVGTFAVQIARALGATVTGVCSTSNLGLVRSLGADEVLDYTKEDVWKKSDRFDVVFDAVGKASRSDGKRLLTATGKYVSVTGSPKRNPDDLEVISEWMKQAKLRPVIDRTYPLDQIREAHAYVEQFRKKGNVVIDVP